MKNRLSEADVTGLGLTAAATAILLEPGPFFMLPDTSYGLSPGIGPFGAKDERPYRSHHPNIAFP